MANYVRMAILAKYPDYDFERYSFKFGDITYTNNGALVFVIHSAINYIKGFIIKPHFGYKKHTVTHINYSDLPYFKKGEFKSEEIKMSNSLRWNVGDFVYDSRTGLSLLIAEKTGDGYYAYVLHGADGRYTETRVYVSNPYRDYIC